MFTGIVEEIGVISSIVRKGVSCRFVISLKKQFKDILKGESIAVNGVCLTVVEIGRNGFAADISEETLKTSTLSRFKIGQKVNLERALALNSRLGGHMMTGHIDGVSEIVDKIARGNGYELFFKVPAKLNKHIVPKGSVALDGISLTVANIFKEGFSVMIIPHTAQYTTLSQNQIGDKVNLEVDILSKYIEGLLKGENESPTEKM